jgi:PIN domain nuclease of toxin-antitoxin system
MYLLDTHVLLWCLENSPRLSLPARQLIIDPKNIVYVSAVSIWEITIKKMLGKLQAPDDVIEVIGASGFKALPITFQDAAAIESLPPIHSDPFDRLLIAQAKVHRLTFITQDEQCLNYAIQTINPV